MKKLFLRLLILVGTILLLIVIAGAVLFFRPELIITPRTLNFALTKSKFFKSWSIKEMTFNHQLIHWNKRRISGQFKDFCFIKENELKKIDACLNSVSWNAELGWTKREGLSWKVFEPLFIRSDKLIVTTKAEDDSPPTDYFKLWDSLWNRFIPEIQLEMRSIDLIDLDQKTKHFSVKLHKDAREINAELMDFKINATKEKMIVYGPRPIRLPVDLKTKNPLYLSELHLIALINKWDVPVTLTGKIDTAKVQLSSIIRKEWIGKDLPGHAVLKNILLKAKGDIRVEKLRQTLFRLMKPPFNELPAPINAMEGSLVISLTTEETEKKEDVKMLVKSKVDLSGAKQFLKFHLNSNFDFDTKAKKPGPILLGVDFEKVVLKMPRLEKNKLPPQFKPDPRFFRASDLAKEKNKRQKKTAGHKKRRDLSMKLEASADAPLQIKTNILDEVLKLYFDLQFDEGKIDNGFIQTLPLKTEVFRRKVSINSVRINYHEPVEADIKADIDFLLPEYTITLKLEGPMSRPRTAFSSKPPLPEDDIIAVLLFGRPLEDLDAEDKTATKTTGQIISQGILSLSVLYFFAGSPIQSIGYDPTTKEVSAQVGLGRKNSLRVSTEGKGVSGAGLRRSLGKGWYIDSSIQKSTSTSGTGNDYGLLLERIISY